MYECRKEGCNGEFDTAENRNIHEGVNHPDQDFLKERFEERYEVLDNGCWKWTSTFAETGYGFLWHDGEYKGAHRVSYTIHNGNINDGMQINHKCHNRWCVNPDHLYEGTQKENADDAKEIGAYTEAAHTGERNANSKLTAKEVGEIKALLSEGDLTQAKIAEEYGVDRSNISRINNGDIWSEKA